MNVSRIQETGGVVYLLSRHRIRSYVMDNQKTDLEPLKICSTCKVPKPVGEFVKNKRYKDGLHFRCKNCCHNYRLQHTRESSLYNKKYHSDHREEEILRCKRYRNEHKEEGILYNKKYNLEHREENALRSLKYHKEHRKELAVRQKEYQKNHKKETLSRLKWRYHNDPAWKIIILLRCRMRLALKRNQKAGHTTELIMCSVSELKTHIEKQWLPRMNWENHGYGEDKWHIDHIIPVSFFDMSDAVEQHMCFRYQNAQPLWQTDNFDKRDKITIQV